MGEDKCRRGKRLDREEERKRGVQERRKKECLFETKNEISILYLQRKKMFKKLRKKNVFTDC